MTLRLRTLSLPVLGLALSAAPGLAAAAPSLEVKIEVPRLSVAEYHRPYVAVWIEGAGQPGKTLSVWYDAKNKEDGGKKWLAEMRAWWRKSGRSQALPADGISGATRAPGLQTLTFNANHPALKGLPAGQYTLSVEAAREVGGEETVRIPFQWPPAKPATASGKGSSELGQITVIAKP